MASNGGQLLGDEDSALQAREDLTLYFVAGLLSAVDYCHHDRLEPKWRRRSRYRIRKDLQGKYGVLRTLKNLSVQFSISVKWSDAGRGPRPSSVISLQAATNLTRLILAMSVPTRLRGGDVGGAGRPTKTDGIGVTDSAGSRTVGC